MKPLIAALAVAGFISCAHADPNDWAEGVAGHNDGASQEFYNRGAFLPWANKMGDWRDAKNTAQGSVPYATSRVTNAQKGAFVEWDVTPLVREWQAGTSANLGFFLRMVDGRGSFAFASREAADASHRPQLVLSGGDAATLAPVADTYLETSTVRSLGNLEVLKVSARPNNALLRFDLSGAKPIGAGGKAVLRLWSNAQTSGADGGIGVFRCGENNDVPDTAPLPGLAARYPGDKGIAADPDVVFFSGFESPDWRRDWSDIGNPGASETVGAGAGQKFVPLQGKALSANLAQGTNTALAMLWRFKRHTGAEPQEMFFRYYLRLGDDWNQTVDGGKLPGFSGTYGRAGWGGRKAHGTDGWSARGGFALTIPEGNPLAGRTPIGSYCYNADMPTNYGEGWKWTRGNRGLLERNRWYCIEQQVRLNDPTQKNGVIRAWVDGRLAFEKTDIRFRTTDALKIEALWMDIYHGGTKPSPYDQHVFLDNLVIARHYIGPMAPGVTPAAHLAQGGNSHPGS